MASLPKSIIKKYGITKKAWSVFRGSKSPKRVTTMARKSRKTHSRKGNTSGLLVTVGSAMAYGIMRNKLSQITATYLPSFAGTYTDELVLGGLGWYLSKKGGVIGAVGKAALIIESASVGNQLGAMMFTKQSSPVIYN